jgi:hypothetical protein
MADLPNQKTLGDVVEQLQELNKATELAQETAKYTQELRDYMEDEGHKLDSNQLSALEDLIQVLKEGRLDELEADKEELLRNRVEMKRDEERNDLLETISKYTSLSFEQLKAEFGDKGRFSILGLLIKTALVGTLVGFFKGAYLEPFKFLGRGLIAISSKIGKLTGLDKFFSNIRVGVQAQITKGIGAFTSIFKTTGNKPPGFMSKSVTMMKNVFIDLFTLIRTTGLNLLKVVSGFSGYFAGRFASLEALTKIDLSPKMISKPFNAVARGIRAFLAPLDDFLNLFKTTTAPAIKQIDRASKAATGGINSVTKIGTSLFNFFKVLKPVQTVFKTLGTIGQAFRGVGQVLGRFFVFVTAIWGAVTGFRDGFKKYEDGSLLTNIFSGIMGAISGVLKAIYGFPLDFVKSILSWVAGFFGFEKVQSALDSFSFSEIIGNIFNFLTETIVGFFSSMSDAIQDIGFAGLIKNAMLNMVKIFKKIALFPSAVAAGGLGAIAAALPGGKTPMEGFTEGFNKVFTAGDAAIDSLKSKADGLNSEGSIIKAKTEEGKYLQRSLEADEKRTAAIERFEQLNQSIMNKGGDVVNVVSNAAGAAVSNVKGTLANVYS